MLTSHLVGVGPRRARPARGRAALVAGVLAALVLGWIGWLVPATPRALADQPSASSVRVDITGFTPEVIDPSDTKARVTLSGTVTNASAQPVAAAQVLLWRSTTPIVSTSRLRSILASDPSTPLGNRLASGSAFQTVTDGRGPLAPGETVTFTVSATASELGIPRRGTSSVALLGVHVLGNLGDRGRDLLGRSRIVAPVLGSTPPRATSLSSVVVLSSRPSHLGGRQFSDDHLAAEVAGNGRLTRLLESAERRDVSWAVDPLLLQSLTVMSGGYSVIGRDGRPHAGAGRESARAWLERYERLDAGRGYRIQVGALDANTLSAADDATRRRWLDAALRAVHPGRVDDDEPVADLPLLVWTTDGALDAGALRLARSWGARAALTGNLASEESVAGGPDGVTLVGYDPGELSGGPQPDPRSSGPQRVERALAQSLLAADSGPAHVRVITDAASAAADRDAPWLRRTPLDRLLAGTGTQPWSGELATSGVHADDLGEHQLAATQRLAEDARDFDELTGDDSGALGRTLLGGALSSWWRRSAGAREDWVSAADARLGALVDGRGLRIHAQSKITLTSERGQFPVTVSNLTDSPANVSVALVSDNAKRVEASGIGVRTIAPGESLTFNASVRARGNGPVPLRVQVRAPDGRDVGRPRSVVVVATNLGAVGWIIVAVSGAVLIGATVLRIRQVRAHGRGTPTSPTPRRP